MFKIISIFFLLLGLLHADILSIHKKIVPIVLLQSTQISQKYPKEINLGIIVSKDEIVKARNFKELLPKNYKNYLLNIHIIYEENLQKDLYNRSNNYDALYIFSITSSNYERVKEYSINNQLLTFSNDNTGLQKGVLFYIALENKIVIYVNKNIMINSRIKFDQRFLRMVKVFEN